MSVIDTSLDIERGSPLRMGLSVQRLFDLLVEEIVSGHIAPGAKLNEPELSRRFGVSRGPLREAIRRLEERHLVRCTPNAGARVIVHTPQEIIEAYEIREALEGMAARLAATNMTDEERAGLRRAFETESRLGISAGYRSDFHMHIVRGSHNERLIRMLNEDYYRLMKLWRTTCRWLRFGGEATWNDHERILEAIEHRDPECAEILMRRHLQRLRVESLKELKRLEGVTVGTA